MSITNQMTDILFKFSEDLVKLRKRCWKPLIDIGIEEGVKINNNGCYHVVSICYNILYS